MSSRSSEEPARDYYKKKLEEKAAEISKLQRKAPVRPAERQLLCNTTRGFHKKNASNCLRNVVDQDTLRQTAKRGVNAMTSREGSRVGTVKRRSMSRGHTRSTSETLKYVTRMS